MTSIEHIDSGKARLEYRDFSIRVFCKYEGTTCIELRIWKLPPKGGFWHMFNRNNLVYAQYGNEAHAIQKLFIPQNPDPNDHGYWLQLFVAVLANNSDWENDVVGLLTTIEGCLENDPDSIEDLSKLKRFNLE